MPKQEKSVKHKFKGIFNFNRELFIEYAYAYSMEQAKLVIMRRIAKKQGVIPSWVFNYFKEHENACEITIETEWMEAKP